MDKDKKAILPGEVFADPTIDAAFKIIFGTEKNKQCTINLLNRILTDHKIVDVTFQNTEMLPECSGSRKSVIDVLCTDDKDNKILVEMQKSKQTHFRERVYFYTSKVLAATEGIKGPWDYNLKPLYAISFLDFKEPVSWMKNRSVLHYVTTGDKGEKMPGSAEFFLFDINNFEKTEQNLGPAMKKWLNLLRDSKLWTDIPDEYQEDEEFAPYFKAARRAAFTPEENKQYITDMMNDWDIENSKREAVAEALAEGEAKGIAKGIAKGKEEGKAEGKAEEKTAIAAKMLKDGVAIEIIAKYTGLPEAQISGFPE